jgi:hypothetical protein
MATEVMIASRFNGDSPAKMVCLVTVELRGIRRP